MFEDSQTLDGDMDVEEDASSTYLTFDLADQTLGVEVRHVREIIDRRKVVRLPNAPLDILGVVDLRGSSVPIVDLRGRFGLAGFELGQDARMILFEFGEGRATRTIGIEADRVRNVDNITPSAIEDIPKQGVSDWDSRYLRGLWRRGEDLVVLVDIECILGGSAPEIDLSAGAGFF